MSGGNTSKVSKDPKVPKDLSLLSSVVVCSVLLTVPTSAADEKKIATSRTAVVTATIDAACDSCSWDTPGREAVTLRVLLNGRYAHHLPLVRKRAEYRVLVGTVDAGVHVVDVEVDPEQTARELRRDTSVMARITRLEATLDNDAHYTALSLAPIVYARPDTIGSFSDVPVFMWYEVEPSARGTRYRYSVIFTNEDGGTPADRLMATWGRTTDIEYLYSVEIDRSGKILRGMRDFRVARDGCFRVAIPLPPDTMASHVRGLRAQAFTRPNKGGVPSRPAAPTRLTRINKVFMLDERGMPGASLFAWNGEITLPVDGPAIELPLK